MLTADPRVVDGARLIEQIRFDEASELASFGAKVLHPSTIAPAVKIGIPVYIYNSRRPEGCGTRITFDAPRRPVSAIAGKRDVALIRIRTPRMLLAHGFMRRIFEIFDENRTSVDVVATSEVSVSMTIDDATHLDGLLGALTALGDVSVERNRGIVALVGAGLGDSTATMAQALAALGNVQGAHGLAQLGRDQPHAARRRRSGARGHATTALVILSGRPVSALRRRNCRRRQDGPRHCGPGPRASAGRSPPCSGSADNEHGAALTRDRLGDTDVVIEFTEPAAAPDEHPGRRSRRVSRRHRHDRLGR